MKIALINPKDNAQTVPETIPFKLLTLATYCEQEGHAVGILDINGLRNRFNDTQVFKNEIIEDDWSGHDMVVVNCDYGQYKETKPILGMLKKYRPECLIVLCGGVPSILKEKTFDYLKEVDVAIIGEPEPIFIDILDRVDSRRFSDIKGIAYRDVDKKIVLTNPRPLIENIDDLPLPDYRIFEGEAFGNYFINSRLGITQRTMMIQRRINLHTQRGTYIDYDFCNGESRWDLINIYGVDAVKKLDKKCFQEPVRYYSNENIISHIDLLRRRYAIDFVSFTDKDFMRDVDRVEDFCDSYMVADLHDYVHWSCVGNVNSVNPALIRKMRESGCEFIIWNIVSNSDKLVGGRIHSSEKNQGVIEVSTNNEMPFGLMMEMGLENEDIDDMLDNLAFCNRFNLGYNPSFSNLKLGTTLFNKYNENIFGLCSDKEKQKIIDKYLCEYGNKPITYVANVVDGTFSEVELLGLREMLRNNDLEGILNYCHQINKKHSDKYIKECIRCGGRENCVNLKYIL